VPSCVQPRLPGARSLSAQDVTSLARVSPLSKKYPRLHRPHRRAFNTRNKNVRRVDRRSLVRVRGRHHHRRRFDLRGVVWKSSGQSSFRDPCVVAVQFVDPARHDAQKSKGRDGEDEDEDEDDSVGRLTSEEAWLFPVVRSFMFFRVLGGG